MDSDILHLNDKNFKEETKTGLVLVDFFANWCGPCRMLAPILEQVAAEFNGKAKVAKVDIDSAQKTAADFKVTSIPTIILIKNGQELKRLVGLRDIEAIREFINSAL